MLLPAAMWDTGLSQGSGEGRFMHQDAPYRGRPRDLVHITNINLSQSTLRETAVKEPHTPITTIQLSHGQLLRPCAPQPVHCFLLNKGHRSHVLTCFLLSSDSTNWPQERQLPVGSESLRRFSARTPGPQVCELLFSPKPKEVSRPHAGLGQGEKSTYRRHISGCAQNSVIR